MTDLETDAIAEGLFKYLLEHSSNPLDAVSILGITLLKVFSRGTTGEVTIEQFMKDFKASAIASYRSASAEGTSTRQ